MAKLSSSLVISLTDKVSGPAHGIMSALGRLKHSADGFSRGQMALASGLMSNLKGLLAAAAAYASLSEGIGGTIGAAIKFEDSMSDIRKVVDFKSPQQFKQMGDDILKMSTQLGMSTSSIAAIVAAWGQANAKPEELLALTQLTAEASVAWETTAAETGDALAKIRTSLGLTVDETRLVADAINFLGNTSASGTKDLLAFSRGLNSGQIAGFAAKETLAFGAAMISAGFESEVAETSFRNMAFALTSGSKATKEQRSAFKRLNLDAKKVSKDMQKDAVGTTLAVLDAIKKLPKDEQGAIAASLFGKEARAIPALLNTLPELRRLLDGVANDATYAGSAHKEFLVAMEKTSANIAKFKSVLSGIGIAIGQMALPTLNKWLTTLSDTLLTLPNRVSIFDEIGNAASGFMSGLGADGTTIAEQFKSLYAGIFGKLTSAREKAAILGEIFGKFRQYGADIRAFGAAVGQSIGDIEKFLHLDPGTIGQTLGTIGENGFKLMLAGVALGVVAKTVRGLAGALYFLSGASTAVGILKTIAGLSGTLTSAAAGASLTGTATGMGTAFGTAFATAAVAAITVGLLEVSKYLDPNGDLWGATTKFDEWVKSKTGWSPSKDGLSVDQVTDTLLPFKGGAKTLWGLMFPDADPNAEKRRTDPGGYDMASRAAYASSPASIAEAAAARAIADARNHRAGIDELPGKMRDDQGLNALGTSTSWFERMSAWWNTPPARSFPGKEADDVYSAPAPQEPNYWLEQMLKAFRGDRDTPAEPGVDRDLTTGSVVPSAMGELAKDVTILGTPTVITQPSGVQQVSLTNPPQPNVYHVSAPVTVNEAANGGEVARQFASAVKTAVAGIHADTNYQAHA